KALSVADNCICAELADHLVFIRRMRNGYRLKTRGLCVLQGQMPKPPDPEHRYALMWLRIRPAQPAINGVTSGEDRGCVFVRNLVRNQVGGVGIHEHVLGVTALCFARCTLQVRTEHPAAALAPFAAAARGLNPRGSHAVAYLPRDDVRSHGGDLA